MELHRYLHDSPVENHEVERVQELSFGYKGFMFS